jgi:guanine deaminase
LQAIRDACKQLRSFQLDGCDVYSSCEPCPMCLGAIYWARPRAVYYGYSREEAAAIGFDDAFIYDEMAAPVEDRRIPMRRIENDGRAGFEDPFGLWGRLDRKVEY